MKKIISILLTVMLLANCGAVSVWATEMGNNPNDPFPDKDFYEDDEAANRVWFYALPDCWTGEYLGAYDGIPVLRKYSFRIRERDYSTKKITGVAFVEGHKESKHPEYDRRGSYFFEGTMDPETRTLTFKGTKFIDYIDNFTFATFTIKSSGNINRLAGKTSVLSNSFATFKSVKYASNSSALGGSFDLDQNVMYPELAEECVEYSLLAYQESIMEPTGYYVNKRGVGKGPLYSKLQNDGVKKKNIKTLISANPSDDRIDSIHWHYAHRTLDDGTELIYVILRGTYKDEWFGDFNVTGTTGTYDDAYAGMHYSFDRSAKALLKDLRKEVNAGGFDKVKYVLTGHSRGAAVANIAAKELTDEMQSDSRIKGVYGYTFATPAVINANQVGDYKNIFNFCLDDDFVTYMPLADANWHYGRYGITYYGNAAKLYKNNSLFKKIINYYRLYERKDKLSYKETGALELTYYLISRVKSVRQFYERKSFTYIDPKDKMPRQIDYSWYDYFYNIFAGMMSGRFLKIADNADLFLVPELVPITSMVMVGGGGYATKHYEALAYLGTHDAVNYYGLIKCLQRDSSVLSESSDYRVALSAQFPYDGTLRSLGLRAGESVSDFSDCNEDDVSVVRYLLETEGNAEKIGWDVDDVSTWEGVTWEDGRITGLDISAYGLTGELDVSLLTELKTLDCSGNLFTYLNIGDCPLTDLSCEGNLLEIYEGSDLKSRINELDDAGGFAYSCYPQGIAEDAVYSESELGKLKALAGGSNLSALEWDIDDPSSYYGVEWGRIGDEYHVFGIELPEKGLTGDIDLSGLDYVEYVDLSNNEISGLDVSECQMLQTLNACNNKLTHLDYADDAYLTTIICDHNYLQDDEYDKLAALIDDPEIVVSVQPQYIDAGTSAFDEDELSFVKDLLLSSGAEVDWTHPGENDCIIWEKISGKNHVTGLDLTGLDLPAEVDLTALRYLNKVSFEDTDVETVRLPQSVQYLSDRAFADCSKLTDLYISDSWNDMGTDVFRNCNDLTIHCIKGSFASFISEELGISFDEVIAPEYIQISGSGGRTAYKGRDYSLNGATVRAYYTDGSDNDVSDEIVVENYDNTKIGSQTIRLVYTEGDYTRTLDLDIEVYGLTDNGLVYGYVNNDEEVMIISYKGSEPDLVIPDAIDDKPVTAIGEYAFSGCAELKKITLPESLESIQEGAFNETGVTGITYKGTVEEWKNVSIDEYNEVILDNRIQCSDGEYNNSGDPSTPDGTHVHDFGGWLPLLPPTETEGGTLLRFCIECKYIELKDVPPRSPSLKAVKILKPKAAKKAATIRWKKISKKNLKKTKKVHIQYSTDSKFRSNVKSRYVKASKTSFKIKGLKKGTTYYVRIRAYTSTDDAVHISKWSLTKPVKAK